MTREEIVRLARIGAKARLAELRRQVAALKEFAEPRRVVSAKRVYHTQTPAGRKAISRRMKAYWRQKRNGGAK